MEQVDQSSDVALMARVRLGDEAAFELLHGRYQQKVLNFFYALSHNPCAANDLCQETFLRVWKIRQRYKASGSFPGYLFAIARMVWLEQCRTRRKQQRLGLEQTLEAEQIEFQRPDLAPDVFAARAEIAANVQHALDELPEEQRLVFVLRAVQGLSLEDIAQALDCPVNTVRSRKLLAIKKLRHLLENVFAATFGEPAGV